MISKLLRLTIFPHFILVLNMPRHFAPEEEEARGKETCVTGWTDHTAGQGPEAYRLFFTDSSLLEFKPLKVSGWILARNTTSVSHNQESEGSHGDNTQMTLSRGQRGKTWWLNELLASWNKRYFLFCFLIKKKFFLTPKTFHATMRLL